MAQTILIKFCVFIVHSKSNNMTPSDFPEKIPVTGKIYFPNAGPKSTHQSRSKSISRVLSQTSRAFFFFSFPPTLKLRVVHTRKKFKKLIFSKISPTILIKFCGLIVHSKNNSVILANSPGKIPETGKIYF